MLKIIYQSDLNKSDIDILAIGLDTNAKHKRGHIPTEEFGFFLHDEDNKIVGGCNGLLYYGCAFVDQLWVDEKYRGQNYGTKLLQTAEDFAKKKNCSFITLETMEWEALEFYKKHGYFVEFEREGYDKNAVMYCLRKDWL